jgi:hypothetical protein
VNRKREDRMREALRSAFLTIYELESLNIIASNRWREDDGSFRNDDLHDEYFFEIIGKNRRLIETLRSEMDNLVNMYPAFVILPLLRAFGSLTVRILKGSSEVEGVLFSVWNVMKRLEKHNASDLQAENGWAVIRSAWTILLKAQEDQDLDLQPPGRGRRS